MRELPSPASNSADTAQGVPEARFARAQAGLREWKGVDREIQRLRGVSHSIQASEYHPVLLFILPEFLG